MTVEFLTMVPTSGDGLYPGSDSIPAGAGWTATREREPTLAYMTQIARAAEAGGFGTLLLPVGTACLDVWVTAAFLAPQTSTLRFMAALRPGFVAPMVAARQASSFDYLSGGRLALNVVTGGSPLDQARDGDFLHHDARYERTQEYIRLVKRAFTESNINHEGTFYRVQDATLFPRPVQQPYPPFFIAGESEAGKAMIAEEAQVYMTWGGPLPELVSKIDDMRGRFAARGRSAGYSISFQVIIGDTEDQAWEKAETMLSRMQPAAIARQREHFKTMDSVGQQRLVNYLDRSAEDGYRLGPNLWAGLTQVVNGNSIALVGTPDQISDRVAEYVTIGFDHVLLRGHPHLEVVEQLGRDVIPRVHAKLAAQPSTTNGSVGSK